MYRTLLDALIAAARTDRGIYIIENSDRQSFFFYRDLYRQSLSVLAGLQAAGVRPGDELVFQFADLRALIVTYWACLSGRIVPVPLEFGDQAAATEKVFAVWRTLGKPWLASDSPRLAEKFQKFADARGAKTQWSAMQASLLHPIDAAQQGDLASLEAAIKEVAPEDIAFIQYSSGSTGAPKGVTLSHRNLLTNIGDILQSVGHAEGDCFLTWKPITHDFGMIAFHLAPIVAASDQVRISTDAFIWNPALWFAMVHKFRASILGSPNFGYRHFLKLFRRGRGAPPDWDLSCVKVILNGAEPISEELCVEFTAELSRFGLPRNAMTPGYGLAEGSLIASLCPVAESNIRSIAVERNYLAVGEPLRFVAPDSPHAAKFVDCGHPYPNTSIRIADAKSQPLADGRVGLIEIRGGSVTMGYYRNPEVSAELIAADGWLNTQDLGAMYEGRLYVVGRVKEMIVIGGVNYFPHDIEQSILNAKGENQLNKYIAVGVQDAESGSEALLLFVYHKRSDGDFSPLAAQLRNIVAEAFGLPVAHVLPTQKIPKTTSGKVQRFRLLQDFLAGEFDDALTQLGEMRSIGRAAPALTPVAETTVAAPLENVDAQAVLARARAIAAGLLGRVDIDTEVGFFDLGFTSLRLLTLKTALEDEFGLTLDHTSSLDFPTVRSLARHIADALQSSAVSADTAPLARSIETDGDIAVVSVACRFPGNSDTPQAYWQLLSQGRDPVREVPAERWHADPQLGTPLTTRQGGFLDGIDRFDPLFFGISPAEATAMDPQQRLLLEVSFEAIENAGWNPQALNGTRTGVFVGMSGSEYAAVGRDLGHAPGPYTFTGTMFNSAAGRIGYTFGLQGPCLAVDTACSSSLVAVLQGMRELRANACDAVLAGGVGVILRTEGHISFSQLNALAESGRCRSFDDSADGYIRGEGCGVVVLKRLADAERDGDPIMAVIKGGAVNHNGRSGGLTVPSGPAQQRLIQAALADAKVQADEIDYVEAHGSGTRLGDPQELNALAQVFKGRSRPLRLGSVKSNLGHLESAAGVAGLIKVVLMLQRGQFVPNLHFANGNSLIDWSSLPLSVVSSATPWTQIEGKPRYAGISSFGISGTNAHLVLCEYQPVVAAQSSADAAEAAATASFVFAFSAKSAAGLQATVQAYAIREDLDSVDFGSLCHSVTRSRTAWPWRFACAADSFPAVRQQLLRWLQDADAPQIIDEAATRHTVFMFTGQGSVYPQVGRNLYDTESVFRAAFDRCDQLFAPYLGISLKDCAFGGKATDLDAASASQALIFTVEHALAALWKSIGVVPTVVLGHSVGEYAAACEAGVITLADAVAMVALRGKIMDDTPADGAMLGVLADEATVRELVARHDGVFIAAINTDENITVSGNAECMVAMLAATRKARVFAEPLPMRHAFHSPLMANSAQRLAAGLQGIRFSDPRITLISSQTGAPITTAADMAADYWSAHLCHPVRFRDALRQALAMGASSFIEIGGTAALSGLAAQIATDEHLAFLPSLREGKDDRLQFNQSLTTLYLRGYRIDWNACYGRQGDGMRGLVAGLPNTAYQRASYWFPALSAQAVAAPMIAASRVETTLPPDKAFSPVVDLRELVTADIREMIGRVTGLAKDQVTDDAIIFELGIDSLMLMQMDKRVVKRFGVDIPVKSFFAELDTPARIAAYVCEHMPDEVRTGLMAAVAMEVAVQPELQTAAAMPVVAAGAGLENIVAQQLEIMREQLALLRGGVTVAPAALPAQMPPRGALIAKSAARSTANSGKNALRGMTLHEEDVSAEQLAFIRDLVARVVARTPKSKAQAQRYRGVFADWIATLNFSLTLKEIAYPVVAARSRGSRFWDIDGNEYLDTATGYGATFFGHNPDFIVEAIRTQLDQGMELGPQSAIAGEVAEAICRLTGVDRASFCNSGTEAVMVAIRLARAVTRRPKIVRFINSYHGSFDGVLAEAGDEGSTPVAPGIVESMIHDTIVLPYGTPDSLQMIRAVGGELAAVLVEPVQSRAPHNHSQDYLRALRLLTEEIGAALIFDEMITGFRIHAGGVQAHYGVRADLTTYGKVIGGGMPIGVVAGRARFMDAIDGGFWQFGDASGPTSDTTFFAGTFCKHPLAMAAARAVLRKLEAEGATLIAEVNARTRRFCDRANAYFAAEAVPIEAQCFGSLYRFETKLSQDPARSALEMNLLFRLMMLDGVFVWERRTSFFSTAHTDADAERILDSVRQAVSALRSGGFSFRLAKPRDAVPSAEVGSESRLSLSSEERRMYVLSLMKGGEYAYHVTGALRLVGRYDRERGERALHELARRHEMLRASYAWQDGNVVRRIADTISLPLAYLTQGEQEMELLLADFIQPFDLAAVPLWRVAVIECGDGAHVLALDFHHLIADGISMSILIEDFFRLYGGETLEAATSGYADFVRWELGFTGSTDAIRQRDDWLNRLQPLPTPLALPTDYARPPHNDFAGASVRFVLGSELQRGVRELARAHRATPFMVLMAAYVVLLRQLTQQSDQCVGTPFDRRGNGNFEHTVGMFAQTLVIRVSTDEHRSFAEVLDIVRQACMDAYAQPNCSLDELVSSLNLPRDFSRNPLFDTMFIFENGDRRVFQNDELSVDTLPVPSKGSAFDLTLEITEQQGVLNGQFIYASRLFSEATILRWADHFEHLLCEIIARPQAAIGSLSLLDAAGRIQLLEAFNRSERAVPRDHSVVTCWRDAVAASPQHKALVAGERALSYAELDTLSDNLARRLYVAGVRRGDSVGILLPRGVGMIAAMLGVLKAGAAYVPLDPDYPAARVAYMLSYSRIAVLLSSSVLSEGLEFGGTMLDPEQLAGPAPDVTPESAAPTDLAYVIFTSGSTGQPKGVMIEHVSVVNFLHGMQDALVLPPHPVVLGLTTISFDIFVLEVFLTFAASGTLVLADEHAQRDPAALANLIHAHGVTVMQATPSRVQALLATREASEVFARMQVLLVGGEAFPRALLSPLQSVAGLRLFNVYGPTETTVWSTVKELTTADTVTLGRPIANTRIYVLDEQLQLRPVGCVGDLWIAGDGLARGYLGDAEKTAAAFVADPFVAGTRMYRTGDRAAWTVEGELVYHGRADNQIKLRGYRIEVQEIEAVLQRHALISLAAVAVRDISPGNPVLVAYCEVRPEVSAELHDEALAAALRAHAATALPAYMVPAVVMRVGALPLTPNGKIDRRNLPPLPTALPSATPSRRHEDSIDALEAEIVQVWKHILGERAIGLHDSFFDVGGNSFSLVSMHAGLAEKFPGVLEVADIFANPTVAALKERIAASFGEEDMPRELSFPAQLLNPVGGPATAETVLAALDQEASRCFADTAARMKAEPFELAVAFFALYLNKLLGVSSFEIAAGFRPRPEYVLVELDFSAVRGLRELVLAVSDQHRSDTWVARKLIERDAMPAHRAADGVRPLLLHAGGDTNRALYGFDIALRLQFADGRLALRADYDSSRLMPAGVKIFVANYLKLIKVLIEAGAAEAKLD